MAILVPEATEAAPAILAWISRFGFLAGAASSLADLLFGSKPSEPSLGNAMRPIVDLLAYPQRAIHVLMAHVNTALDYISHALVQTNNRLGNAYNSSLRFARQWDAELRAALTAKINYVNDRVGAAYNSALQHARIWDAQLRDHVEAQVQYLNDRIGAAYNSALQHARVWDAQLRQQLHAEIAYVNDRVGAAYNSALQHARQWDAETRTATTADITQQTTRGIAATWPVLLTELAGATTAAGADLPGLTGLIRAVPTAAPTTLEQAAADPLAITRVLTRAMTDCTIPNCRNLSKYGRDLHGLGDLLSAAGLLAFLAYAVHNPKPAADDTWAVLGPIVDGVGHAVRDVVNL
jgi:hypothetical protein